MAFMDVGDMSLIFDMSFMAWLGVWLMPHSIRVGARENAPSICPWQILQARPLNRMKASSIQATSERWSRANLMGRESTTAFSRLTAMCTEPALWRGATPRQSSDQGWCDKMARASGKCLIQPRFLLSADLLRVQAVQISLASSMYSLGITVCRDVISLHYISSDPREDSPIPPCCRHCQFCAGPVCG